jgi:hypothetical protein
MKNSRAAALALLIVGTLIASGCLGGGASPSTTSSQPSATQPETTTTQEPSTWEMKMVWSANTTGIPFMDLAPDGSLAAAVDWNRGLLYLVRPDGSNKTLDLRTEDWFKPIVAGVAVMKEEGWILASYDSFAGLRSFSWDGFSGNGPEKVGALADFMLRSPNGGHICYLVTLSPTEQELNCDGRKTVLSPNDYSLLSVSDSGIAVISEDGKAIVFRDGKRMLSFNTDRVIAYRERLIVSENGTLKVFSLNGTLLARAKGYEFGQTVLLRWTLLPTESYLLRHEPFGDTHVLTWNLTEVATLPGFPYFANDHFAVTSKDGVIHCYSLDDLHEVFSVSVPGDSLGYVKLSDDGKVMLVSGETGSFWLYRVNDVKLK